MNNFEMVQNLNMSFRIFFLVKSLSDDLFGNDPCLIENVKIQFPFKKNSVRKALILRRKEKMLFAGISMVEI